MYILPGRDTLMYCSLVTVTKPSTLHRVQFGLQAVLQLAGVATAFELPFVKWYGF